MTSDQLLLCNSISFKIGRKAWSSKELDLPSQSNSVEKMELIIVGACLSPIAPPTPKLNSLLSANAYSCL